MMNQKPFSTDNPFQHADAFYEQLLDAHSGLSPDASEALNARLILVMAHHIADLGVLQACLTTANSVNQPTMRA